ALLGPVLGPLPTLTPPAVAHLEGGAQPCPAAPRVLASGLVTEGILTQPPLAAWARPSIPSPEGSPAQASMGMPDAPLAPTSADTPGATLLGGPELALTPAQTGRHANPPATLPETGPAQAVAPPAAPLRPLVSEPATDEATLQAAASALIQRPSAPVERSAVVESLAAVDSLAALQTTTGPEPAPAVQAFAAPTPIGADEPMARLRALTPDQALSAAQATLPARPIRSAEAPASLEPAEAMQPPTPGPPVVRVQIDAPRVDDTGGARRESEPGEAAPEPGAAATEVHPTGGPERAPVTLATAAGAPAAHTPALPEVAPSVVGQIAQQVDLYRLPGGRGVRIQLHPEDLGGVDVTIRFGASGDLELHVSVERATTADLVQAGWSDLRDALSVQGIAPERLIVSLSGPAGAHVQGDSPGAGGARSDGSGQASFGQAGQHERHAREQARSARFWWTGADAQPSADDIQRLPGLPSSYIDYRV
ncbi:MAG: flagellar hook-length control protein FliK, partial [Chloroflexota bacterium]|nr:flagellar hook-length control protein FliK [Chloroflexota bacterium]